MVAVTPDDIDRIFRNVADDIAEAFAMRPFADAISEVLRPRHPEIVVDVNAALEAAMVVPSASVVSHRPHGNPESNQGDVHHPAG